MRPDLSIVIPAYNEEHIIRQSLRKLARFLDAHRDQFDDHEVIVVAAGDDQTARFTRQFAGEFRSLNITTPDERVGKGRDVLIGMRMARGDVVVFMDADLSTPLSHLLPLMKTLQSGEADVVIGTRDLSRIHQGRLRSWLSVASNWLTRALLFPRIRDTQCGFKGFTQAAKERLFAQQKIVGWGFDLEVLQYAKEAQLRIKQLPINDWHETRKNKEDFRGEFFASAALTSLNDLILVRTGAWVRSLARRWQWPVLLGMIASFSLAMWLGLQQSVWFDEAYSITLIKQSFANLMHLTSVDAHPPVYYLLLKVWSMLFGTAEAALRSFSALCLALSVGAGAWLAKRLFNASAALAVLPFLVCAPFLLRYGFEIRMYALAMLIGLVATHVMVSALHATGRKKRLWWAGYAALVTLGMLTLYYTVLIWIAHLVWLTYQARKQVPHASVVKQPWIAAFVGSVLLFVPWLPTFYDQLTHSALSGVSEAVTFRELISIPSFMFSFLTDWQLGPWESLLIILALIGIGYVVAVAWKMATGSQRRSLALLIAYFMVPILLLLIGSLPPLRPMFLERYVSHTVIAGYLLLGVCLAVAYQSRYAKRAVVVGLFVLALSVGGIMQLQRAGNFTFERVMRPHAKQVAAAIGDCRQATVLAGDPLLYFEMSYYITNCDLRFFNNDQTIGDRGGYAILHNSPQEVFTTQPFNAASTVYYAYTSEQPPFMLPAVYHAVSEQQFEKFHLVEYQRD